MAAWRYKISLLVLKNISRVSAALKYFFATKGAIDYVAIVTVIFSRVKISCFRGKAHLVFHWYFIVGFDFDMVSCSVQI